ncbi:MAG: PD40 domain-containing protein [Verrucomicrobiae bacterium]|nr:PD40 domain-containing protein [Verrucomicrobiae bacterium]
MWSFRCSSPLALTLLVSFLGQCIALAGEARLLRFPAIHGDQIAFGYAGDLYTVSAQGGLARRLTSDPNGYEMFPRFSPDGKHLAFTAQYDGNTEVYVMPAQGGTPRRLTYTATLDRDDVSDRMGPNNIVMTWRDNDTVVYRSRWTQWNPFKGELALAKLGGGVFETLPLPAAAEVAAFRPTGSWLPTTASSANSAPGSVTAAARPMKSGSTASTPGKPPGSPKSRAGHLPHVWRGGHTLLRLRARRQPPGQPLRARPRHEGNTPTDALHGVRGEISLLGDQAIVFENGGFIHRVWPPNRS